MMVPEGRVCHFTAPHSHVGSGSGVSKLSTFAPGDEDAFVATVLSHNGPVALEADEGNPTIGGELAEPRQRHHVPAGHGLNVFGLPDNRNVIQID
jgi:hypothetical protein